MRVSEWTEGLKKKEASLVIGNPSVKPSVCQLPVEGSLLVGDIYKLLHDFGGPPMTAPTTHPIKL